MRVQGRDAEEDVGDAEAEVAGEIMLNGTAVEDGKERTSRCVTQPSALCWL